MQFVDEAKVYIKSGDGGAGCLSFRREKFIPFGGPDGGDGGRGGSVIARCVNGLNTLVDYRFQQHFKARKGMHGKGSNRTGESADDLFLDLPIGTQIFDEESSLLLADLTEAGQTYIIAKGGKGGLGNAHFKSSTNQAPRLTIPGEPGEERTIRLRLKLLSDAGLIGMPNAGKSTFLASVSRAKPKIADYPFTTLTPHLGVVTVHDDEFVLADLPGLIEGAHEGVGLGLRFLGHVERCGVLLHLVDSTQEDIAGAYRLIRHEIGEYEAELLEKPELVALSKADALDAKTLAQRQQELAEASGSKVYVISAASRLGVDALLNDMMHIVKGRNEDD